MKNKTTVEGLEKRLRKLRCWAKFQKLFKSVGYTDLKHWVSIINLEDTYRFHVRGLGFPKDQQSFWQNIVNKIDEVKL